MRIYKFFLFRWVNMKKIRGKFLLAARQKKNVKVKIQNVWRAKFLLNTFEEIQKREFLSGWFNKSISKRSKGPRHEREIIYLDSRTKRNLSQFFISFDFSIDIILKMPQSHHSILRNHLVNLLCWTNCIRLQFLKFSGQLQFQFEKISVERYTTAEKKLLSCILYFPQEIW